MDIYDMFSVIAWVLVISAISSGLFWWIPTYVPQESQEITTKWILSAVSIFAVVLNLGRDFSSGEKSVRVYTVLTATILIVGISMMFMYWYIPTYIEKDSQLKQQELALMIMSILLTVLNIGSEVVRSLYPYQSYLLKAGRRHK